MRKKWLYLVILIQVLIIGSLIKGVGSSLSSGKRVEELIAKRDQLLSQQAELKQKGEVFESEYYVEKLAREQLHLVKPGETVVVLRSVPEYPPDLSEDRVELANWQKWLGVLGVK